MLSEQGLNIIINTLKNHSEYDLTLYSPKSLFRRVERFMINHQINEKKMVSMLVQSEEFATRLLEEITVNTTEFFRDPDIWQFLKLSVLPVLARRNRINIWVAGASKGQEVYSLIIMLNEAGLLQKSHIIATDINQSVLNQAKKGEYRYLSNLDFSSNFDKVINHNPLDYSDIKNISPEKYFTIDKKNNKLWVSRDMTRKPVFIRHDLVKNNGFPSAKFDFILCRNVLIYFNHELQNKVLADFYRSMFPDSFLLLGVHESIIGPQSLHFRKKGKVYINL